MKILNHKDQLSLDLKFHVKYMKKWIELKQLKIKMQYLKDGTNLKELP